MNAILFYLFAAVTAGSALGVVVSRNIVRAAVFLLSCLLGVAGVYVMLSATFLAAVQLIVYAGGILVLIIFGVMLTGHSPRHHYEPKRWEILAASLLGGILLATLSLAILSADMAANPLHVPGDEVSAFGVALLGPYLVPFEISGVLLLLAMMGAAYLARRRAVRGDGT